MKIAEDIGEQDGKVRGAGDREALNEGGQKAWQARVIHDAAVRLRNECQMPKHEAWAFI